MASEMKTLLLVFNVLVWHCKAIPLEHATKTVPCMEFLRMLLRSDFSIDSCGIIMEQMDFVFDIYDIKLIFDMDIPFFVVSQNNDSKVEETHNILLQAMNQNCTTLIVSAKDICNTFSVIYHVNRLSVQRRPKTYLIVQTNEEFDTEALLRCECVTFFPFAYTLKESFPSNRIQQNDCSLLSFKLGNNLKPTGMEVNARWNGKIVRNLDNIDHNVLQRLNGLSMSMVNLDFKLSKLNAAQSDWKDDELMQELSKQHNFSWEVKVSNVIGKLSDNQSSGTFYGSLKNLLYHVGTPVMYFTQDSMHHFDFSTPLTQSYVKILTPSPKRKQYLWSIFSPFASDTWIGIVSLILFASVLLYLISIIQSFMGYSVYRIVFHEYCYFLLCVISIIVGLGVPGKFSSAIKHLIVSLFITSTLLVTAYNCNLVSFLSLPVFEKPIDTLQEFLESELPLGTDTTFHVDLFKASELNLIYQIHKRFNVNEDYQGMNTLAKEGKMAFVCYELASGCLYYEHFIDTTTVHHLRVMKEPVFSINYAIPFHKSSPLVEAFNPFFFTISESGIYNHFLETLRFKQKLILAKYLEFSSNSLRVLSMRHLVGSFILLLVGLALSFIVFVVDTAWKIIWRYKVLRCLFT